MTEIERLQQTIHALESQRAALGDMVVDTALAPLRAQLGVLQTQPDHVKPQRKQITILFADVSGFTALTETMDAEDVSDVINALWQRLDRAIVQHGGRIDKHIGDAVMALWGVTSAREDDAEQAIRAALELQTALAAFRQEYHVPLAMRIGLNTGLAMLTVVGTTREFTALGDTVNLASRLEHEAPVGGVLISHDTYQHVRGRFNFAAQPPLAIRGKTEPVQSYVVTALRSRRRQAAARGVEGITTRLIGREAELQQLQTLWRQVLDQHQLHSITVVGEAGLGKSRLLREFQDWLLSQPDEVMIWQGTASESLARQPYALLRDLLAFRFNLYDSDPLPVARRKLETGLTEFLRGTPNPIEKAHFIGQLIGLDFSNSPHLRGILDDPAQINARALHYLSEFIAALTQQGRLVLLLEDLHWADDQSLEAITRLAADNRQRPWLLIGLARPTLFERRSAWGRDGAAHVRLDLAPLPPLASQQLVDEILRKAQGVPAEMHDQIVTSAEGNPFYVEELINVLIDEKVIVPADDHWRIDRQQFEKVRVPQTLTGLLQARLDSLPKFERAVLMRASVVGRVFWDEAVRALQTGDDTLGAETSTVMRAALQRLSSRDLIFKRDPSAFAETQEFAFRHTLSQEVTYEMVLKRLRRIYHAQAAAWLIKRSGERADEYAGLIAEHYERAGDQDQAAGWYARAGKQALKAYAPETAIDSYQKAIELATPDQTQLDWHEGLGAALWRRARFDEAIAAYEVMYAAAEQAGERLMQAKALNNIAIVQGKMGEYHTMLENARRGAQLSADQQPDRLIYLEALRQQSFALYRLGQIDDALTLAEQGWQLSDQQGENARYSQAACLNLMGTIHDKLGHVELGERYKGEALVLMRQIGDRRGERIMHNNLGVSATVRGDYALAVQYIQSALVLAREVGDRDGELLALCNLAESLVGLGNYAAAETTARQVIDLIGPTEWYGLPTAYAALATACLEQARFDEALTAAQTALTLALTTNDQTDIGAAWRVLGNCAAALALAQREAPGVPPPAACYTHSVQIFASSGAEVERARTLREWARYELTQGDHEQGTTLWQQARALFEQHHLTLEVRRMDVMP